MTIFLQSVNEWVNSVNDLSNKRIINRIAHKLRQVHQAIRLKDRITRLESLIIICNKIVKELKADNDEDATLLSKIDLLKTQALSFLKAILNAENDKELIIKLDENRKITPKRKHILFQNTNLLSESYDVLKMRQCRVGEDKGELPVIYLDKNAREESRVILSKGKFQMIISANKDKPDDSKLFLLPFYTEILQRGFEPDAAIIVADKKGNMFVGKTEIGKFHHSSLISGKSVIFAGIIKTNVEGELVTLTNESGHYRPDEEHTINFLKFLGKRGALSKTNQIFICGKKSRFGALHKSNIDLLDLQQTALKEFNPQSTLKSYNKWRKTSNAGFFARRYKILQKIDQYLLQYFKSYSVNSPKENLQLLNKIIDCIVTQQKTHPNSKRQSAITALANEIVNEANYWININERNDMKDVDNFKLRIRS